MSPSKRSTCQNSSLSYGRQTPTCLTVFARCPRCVMIVHVSLRQWECPTRPLLARERDRSVVHQKQPCSSTVRARACGGASLSTVLRSAHAAHLPPSRTKASGSYSGKRCAANALKAYLARRNSARAWDLAGWRFNAESGRMWTAVFSRLFPELHRPYPIPQGKHNGMYQCCRCITSDFPTLLPFNWPTTTALSCQQFPTLAPTRLSPIRRRRKASADVHPLLPRVEQHRRSRVRRWLSLSGFLLMIHLRLSGPPSPPRRIVAARLETEGGESSLRLAAALRARRVTQLRKADLLLLCREWRYASPFWRAPHQPPPRLPSAGRGAAKAETSSGLLPAATGGRGKAGKAEALAEGVMRGHHPRAKKKLQLPPAPRPPARREGAARLPQSGGGEMGRTARCGRNAPRRRSSMTTRSSRGKPPLCWLRGLSSGSG